jgi:hypothetical protein
MPGISFGSLAVFGSFLNRNRRCNNGGRRPDAAIETHDQVVGRRLVEERRSPTTAHLLSYNHAEPIKKYERGHRVDGLPFQNDFRGKMIKRVGMVFVASVVVAVAAAPTRPTSKQMSQASAPHSAWYLTGSSPESYEAGWLPSANAAFYLRSRTPGLQNCFGTWGKYVDATPYAGKRVRLSANIAAKDVSGWSGIWVRVDGKNSKVLAFDNMQDRPIRGTLPSRSYEVVLDVPPEATGIGYGVLLADSGDVNVTETVFQIVGTDVATTKRELHDGDWFLAGSAPQDYVVVPSKEPGLVSSLHSISNEPVHGFGTWMTQVDASPYVGKRVRLRARVSAKSVKGWAGLWMRVDEKKPLDSDSSPNTLAFDNMADRPLTGTSDAAPYSVVLNVPPGAAKIYYGVLLNDTGEVGISDLKLEVVPDSVPVTGNRH